MWKFRKSRHDLRAEVTAATVDRWTLRLAAIEQELVAVKEVIGGQMEREDRRRAAIEKRLDKLEGIY